MANFSEEVLESVAASYRREGWSDADALRLTAEWARRMERYREERQRERTRA